MRITIVITTTTTIIITLITTDTHHTDHITDYQDLEMLSET